MKHLIHQRLLHDCCVPSAKLLVETIENVLRPEDRLEAFNEFYVIVRSAIEKYCLEYQRMMVRIDPLKPSNN